MRARWYQMHKKIVKVDFSLIIVNGGEPRHTEREWKRSSVSIDLAHRIGNLLNQLKDSFLFEFNELLSRNLKKGETLLSLSRVLPSCSPNQMSTFSFVKLSKTISTTSAAEKVTFQCTSQTRMFKDDICSYNKITKEKNCSVAFTCLHFHTFRCHLQTFLELQPNIHNGLLRM